MDGSEALHCLSTDFTIDVVITDLVMPEMSGLELYQRAQTIERFNDEGVIPPPPFLLLTSFDKTNLSAVGKTDFKEAQRCFAAILHKPVEEAILLPMLQKIRHQRTEVGHNTAQLRDILQQSLRQLGQTNSRDDVTAVVQQLQQQLEEFKMESVTS